MKRFLVLFRGYPDLDHITPFVWKCLEKGDRAIAVFERPYPFADDFRVQFLRRYPGFQVLELAGVGSRSRAVWLGSRLLWTPRRAAALLRAHRVDACIFEWGPGIGPRERNVTLARRLVRAWRAGLARPSRRDVSRAVGLVLKPLRTSLLIAAARAGLPTFALPHGMRVIPDPALHAPMAARLRRHGGEDPQEDQNCFTVYVLNTDVMREHMIRHNRLDPRIGQTWGSLRFCPEWRRILADIVPPARLPDRRPGQARAVFFLPKWEHFVDEAGTLALLRSLAARDDLQLVVKGHPRPGRADLGRRTLEELGRRPGVVLAGDAHSGALIAAADVVILLMSSLAVEALLQRKPVLHAAYLHPNRLVYDGYPGVVPARSPAEAHALLDRVVRGDGPRVDEAAVRTVERDFAYAGREPFDVPGLYYDRIQSYLAPRPRMAEAVGAPPDR